MSVETVLKKICDHNAEVLGCIASNGDRVFQELPEMYQLLDANTVREHTANMFELMDGLDSGADAFDQLFLEYQDHSIAGRRLDDGVLVLITSPVARADFKKTQVGINLFMKPLKRALGEAGTVAEAVPTTPEPEVDPAPDAPKTRMYRGVAY